MTVDDEDSLGLSVFGQYEPCQTQLIKDNLREGEVFIDLGANIGYFTLIASKIVGPKGHVYAFEPNPVIFSILKN